ncbi:MAG: methylated-DNA--[protein]-cysteine S-methyltransferase [Planctomycetota bacterium]|nr:methylated-DNA--[protein]-cysteine S-methyltransferase [Planctomycetota bacterium]
MEGTSLPSTDTMYAALCERDASFEGVFVAAIRTTGIFCRPGCPARTPNPGNVAYFAGTAEALHAGYRPCKRCRPMAPAGAAPEWLAPLLAEVEADRTRRWRDRDLVALGLEPKRVRRWFLAHHGMTFHAYQRARRLGLALGALQAAGADGSDAGPRADATISDVALDVGFASESGFREAFGKLFQATPTASRVGGRIEVGRLTTPLGPMLFGVLVEPGGRESLVLLEFTDRRALEGQLTAMVKRTGAVLAPGSDQTELAAELCDQLAEYFAGERRDFDLAIGAPGTPFQEQVWAALQAIPYGETRSYADIAAVVGRPGATRAVGTTNGKNRIAVVIPCHRVVRSDGSLSGYGGGLWRKQALLDLERGQASS